MLPLYETPKDPNGWHRVIAPGGHEWWHFVATDDVTGVRVSIDLLDGDFHAPTYRQAYERFRKKPTRNAPPVPRDFPCLRVDVLEKNGTSIWTGNPKLAPGAITGELDRPEVSAGKLCTMRFDDAGHVALSIHEMPSLAADASCLSLQLVFRPDGSIASTFDQTVSDDPRVTLFRLVPCSKYAVAGEIEIKSNSAIARTIPISGRGEHDHTFATGIAE